jgi:hypothetical protein
MIDAIAACRYAALLVVVGAGPVRAEPQAMDGPAIEAALAGNTVHGMWGKREYWSWFAPNGGTTYVTKGAPPEHGRWRASATQYCSTWPGSGESCYELLRDGDTIIWVMPGTGERRQSTLLPGNQLP